MTDTPPPPANGRDDRERFALQHPTLNPDPVWARPPDPQACGNCPGWKRQNPKFPFGQCLLAIRALGQPMYTPDHAACSLPMDVKIKGHW